ncbi:MAG: leucine-rich repeat domain-containing protein [Paludibacteraceae bacterium]|nr:leucine-rich repeat domain-containing protein [Paludibacteraceae bacterium]
MALIATTAIWGSNVITYTASAKLETLSDAAFNVSISSHTFSNGIGTITFSGEVTTIGNNAFIYSSLTSIVIPNSVTTIGENAFKFCTSLVSVTIGNSVATIGVGAFYGCWSLKSITIPDSVTQIGALAFGGCPEVTSITCNAITPPICDLGCFDDIDKSILVYVPSQSVNVYKQAKEWKDFTNIKPIEQTDLYTLPYERKDGIGSAAKFIRNNQLQIMHNGKLYNAAGIRMR